MDLFDVLKLIGGLCLFLFGMNLMGAALEKRAGHSLNAILGKFITGKIAGFLTGLGVTSIIQSSSATTVMVVGFVNSGIMTLRQAINVIMGANVGTTVTAWLLSLTGIESGNLFVQMLKPTSFTPILALIGTVLYMMPNADSKKKDTAHILLGFATLMFGMDIMSGSVAGLKDVEAFRNILIMFSNPILGVLAGAVLTAMIQSSSASVGILQALSSTGQITMGAAIPIIMGQNIGTCVTALISSIGTNRNARRASLVHLCFNIIGTALLLCLFCAARALFDLSAFVGSEANEMTIAVAHSVFNILCTIILLPASGLLEKLSYKLIPEPKNTDSVPKDVPHLDERMMATPSIALEQCRHATHEMADIAFSSLHNALSLYDAYDNTVATSIHQKEELVDRYEDMLGSYLVKLNTYSLSDEDSHESTKLLHMIGDLERLSDHAVNVLESMQELQQKGVRFTQQADRQLRAMMSAVSETLELTQHAYEQNDLQITSQVEPLEQIANVLKDQLRAQHILRMQRGECSVEAGFIWSDLLTNLERISDHCSNIAGCVIEMAHEKLDLHDYLKTVKANSPEFAEIYGSYAKKYLHDAAGL
ncbi:MAG: Na/Pi cotransporter family protein [Ruminococcaceae bacterium]|nr:Na/Pi cotransporter family protein [Oscillospiraceae bacterium]